MVYLSVHLCKNTNFCAFSSKSQLELEVDTKGRIDYFWSMLEISAQIATLLSLVLFLLAFITAFLILKEYRIPNIRFSRYFKLFLGQALYHSLLLVLSLFFPVFKTAFLLHSFGMVPLYGLLFFRFYHLKELKFQAMRIKKAIMLHERRQRKAKSGQAKPKMRLIRKGPEYRWR